MGLDVDVFGPEDLLRPSDGQLLDRINVLAATIIALAGIPLRILVRHQAALRRQDGRTGKVLGRDEQQLLPLSFFFGADRLVDVRVCGSKCVE